MTLDALAARWGGANPQLIAARENRVYRIETSAGPLAMRLHRAGYQTKGAIESELRWTERLANAGFSCPRPTPCLAGVRCHEGPTGGYVTTVSWVDGTPIGDGTVSYDGPIDEHLDLYQAVGAMIADLHRTTASIETDDIERHAWDLDGLTGEAPFWGRFWENPTLSEYEAGLLSTARTNVRDWLSNAGLAEGLIHADALQENVFQTENGLALIDFDDAGYGYLGYDLGVALSQHWGAAHLDDLAAAVVDGYGRGINKEEALRFMAIRSLASCGWIVPRQPDKPEAIRRYAARAVTLAERYLT